jgi:Ca-activated chloride channel homolog
VTTPPPGRSKAARRRKRRVRTKTLVFLAVAACVLFMVGRGVAQIASHISCTNHPLVINVAVSTDISQPVNEVAGAFNREHRQVGGHCVAVRINSGSPATAAAQIDGQRSDATGKPINAWIPDSILWVDEVRQYPAGVGTVVPAGFSVARSPLMIVMPTVAAARTPAFGKDGWKLLLPPSAGGPAKPANLIVDLPDPALNAAGLATLIEESRLFGSGQTARLKFTQFAHNATVTSYFDDPSSLGSLVSLAAPPLDDDPVTVTTEQAVIAYDSANPRALAAVYPTGHIAALGDPEFDYPYVLLASNTPEQVDAAQAFGQMLRGSYAISVIRLAGFRAGGQSPGIADRLAKSFGLQQQLLQVAPLASNLEAPAALQSWNKLSLWSRDLVMIDVSGNMNKQSFYGAPTYEQELSKAATIGLGLFANTADIGLWVYAARLDGALPYKNLMPIGPLPGYVGKNLTRRDALERINGSLATTNSDNVALYGTILRAFKYMQSIYQPKFFNALVVLGSGIENAPGDVSGPALVRKLTRLDSSARKVTIVMVIFGQPPNFHELQRIAAATGGQAYAITTPTQVAKVFYEALAHRLCTAGCATP